MSIYRPGIVRLTLLGLPNSPPPTPCQRLPTLINQWARFADILDWIRIGDVHRFVVVKGRTTREAYLLDFNRSASRDWSQKSVIAQCYRQRF